MAITLAFDVYGTLIDTHGIVVLLEKHLGSSALDFSRMWREKQLEYSFRRGLMQNYETFAVCTSDALDYTSAYFKTLFTRDEKDELLNAYRTLPAFKDAREGLALLEKAGVHMFAFSNGDAEAVETLLRAAGIRDHFRGIVSVDEMKSFKPNPAVYCHFLRKAGTIGAEAWLVSSNPFDVIGAISAGMRAVWVQRSLDAIFDPWGIEPTITVNSLSVLAEQIREMTERD